MASFFPFKALPGELVREVMETTAFRSREDMVQLMLVSRKVHLWIEPLFYEVVVLLTQNQVQLFVRTIEMKEASNSNGLHVISNSIQILQVGSRTSMTPRPSSLLKILHTCKNAKSVFLAPSLEMILPGDIRNRVATLLNESTSPQKLRVCGVGNLIPHMLRQGMIGCFTNLTHLLVEMIDPRLLKQDGQPYPFPALTHVVFSGSYVSSLTDYNSSPVDLSTMLIFLSHSVLEVCGVVVNDEQRLAFEKELQSVEGKTVSEDLRLPQIFAVSGYEGDTWTATHSGRSDLFSIAENIVKARQAKSNASR
ncbi:hypothetical protein DL96DRAFT_636550 [Flagelloscypha sp. PMI_526]|nr:hypothetical protein DL96DRAFT_636550 [Flagelloscypha sp. PMI_526]